MPKGTRGRKSGRKYIFPKGQVIKESTGEQWDLIARERARVSTAQQPGPAKRGPRPNSRKRRRDRCKEEHPKC